MKIDTPEKKTFFLNLKLSHIRPAAVVKMSPASDTLRRSARFDCGFGQFGQAFVNLCECQSAVFFQQMPNRNKRC